MKQPLFLLFVGSCFTIHVCFPREVFFYLSTLLSNFKLQCDPANYLNCQLFLSHTRTGYMQLSQLDLKTCRYMRISLVCTGRQTRITDVLVIRLY